MDKHQFRFGVVAAQAASGQDWLDKARQIESEGFDTLLMPDGLQHVAAPFPALAAAATATRSLRVGTYVVANDYRHPVMLAKEAATLSWLSGGRFELGIGAGRPSAAPENAMLGQPFDAGAVRVARLAEALAIVKPLLRGEKVDFEGMLYNVRAAAVSDVPIETPPILIGANQRRLLELAAREGDASALGLQPDATEAQIDQRVSWIREAAGPRFPEIEINVNLMAVAGQVPRYLEMTMGTAAAEMAASDAPLVLKGSVDQMCDKLEWLRGRFGISYIAVSDELRGAIGPVVTRLAGK